MGASVSKPQEPCHEEFEAYMRCVESHAQGLKALDCEDIKDLYKKCMKTSRPTVVSSK
jgi:hypothetical protein